MQLSDQQKKSACIAIACLFLLSALVAATQLRPAKLKPPEPSPVPLGTNELKIGAKLFNPYPHTNHVFTVIEMDRAYDFPDGEMRPGVRIKSEVIGGSTWVPRENLDKFHVVQ